MLQPLAVAMASTADLWPHVLLRWRHVLLRLSEEQLKPNSECAGMHLVLEGPVPGVPPELSD